MSQLAFAFGNELIVDLFAGGGGASTGIEQAFGRPVDICVNHDADAVAMHAINHPHTEHLRADVFEVNPLQATRGRQVGLLWASPDCKHFSKAKGGKPRSKKIRSLAWVVVKWATIVRPRVIMLENVEEFVTWGPLAKSGQPCPERKGQTFRRWVGQLRKLGYKVEWRELRACDYGAPTIRKRFFLIARCDGLPIRWPAATHGKPDSPAVLAGKLPAWRTAADCIDFTLPCPSIFLTPAEARPLGVKRPLAEATMRRIAKGVFRFVINAAKPFIVPLTHQGERRGHDVDEALPTVTGAHRGELALIAPVLTEHANASRQAVWRADEALRTQCAEVKGGHFALVAPTLVQTGYGERAGQAPRAPGLDVPLGTAVAGGVKHALVANFLSKYHGEKSPDEARGIDPTSPAPTLDTSNRVAVVGAHLLKQYGGNESPGWPLDSALSTVTSKDHHHLVTSHLQPFGQNAAGTSPADPLQTAMAGATRYAEVRAFLVKFYSLGGQHAGCDEPMHTVPTRDRMGLVTVNGEDYAIADIGLRMLTPRELFRAQGFPEGYIIDRGVGGKRLPKDAQVRMCGNSVCPPMAKALVEANVAEIRRAEQVAA